MIDRHNERRQRAFAENASGKMLDMQAMLAELEALDSLEYDIEARKRALAGKPGEG